MRLDKKTFQNSGRVFFLQKTEKSYHGSDPIHPVGVHHWYTRPPPQTTVSDRFGGCMDVVDLRNGSMIPFRPSPGALVQSMVKRHPCFKGSGTPKFKGFNRFQGFPTWAQVIPIACAVWEELLNLNK